MTSVREKSRRVYLPTGRSFSELIDDISLVLNLVDGCISAA